MPCALTHCAPSAAKNASHAMVMSLPLCTRHAWGVSLASLPCEAWLSRRKCTNGERADVYDLLLES